MLTELERYGEQDETELRFGWIWGTTIKDHNGVIVKRVAWKEGGAYLNGNRIQVSNANSLKNSLLSTGFP